MLRDLLCTGSNPTSFLYMRIPEQNGDVLSTKKKENLSWCIISKHVATVKYITHISSVWRYLNSSSPQINTTGWHTLRSEQPGHQLAKMMRNLSSRYTETDARNVGYFTTAKNLLIKNRRDSFVTMLQPTCSSREHTIKKTNKNHSCYLMYPLFNWNKIHCCTPVSVL